MKPDYSHTYRTCLHSMKREKAPWRVYGSCNNRAHIFIGRHYELPNQTVCMTCPFYTKDEDTSTERRKK